MKPTTHPSIHRQAGQCRRGFLRSAVLAWATGAFAAAVHGQQTTQPPIATKKTDQKRAKAEVDAKKLPGAQRQGAALLKLKWLK